MFDLPVMTKQQKREAAVFRYDLLDLGFDMAQFSVYVKYCPSTEKAESVCNKVQRKLPPGGKVDMLTITDKQFSNIKRFYADKRLKNAKKPDQLHLF